MPRFYFDIREDDRLVSDDEGNDLPNIDAAEREAVLVATEIVSDKVKRGRIQKVIVEVRNEDGQRLLTSTVTLQTVSSRAAAVKAGRPHTDEGSSPSA
jgi:hypothetical protein